MTALRTWRTVLWLLSVALFVIAAVLFVQGNRGLTGWLMVAGTFLTMAAYWLLRRDRASAG